MGDKAQIKVAFRINISIKLKNLNLQSVMKSRFFST